MKEKNYESKEKNSDISEPSEDEKFKKEVESIAIGISKKLIKGAVKDINKDVVNLVSATIEQGFSSSGMGSVGEMLSASLSLAASGKAGTLDYINAANNIFKIDEIQLSDVESVFKSSRRSQGEGEL